MLDLNSTIGRYSGGRIPPQGLGAQGGETPVLHHIPPHLQPSLAALTLGAGGQPGSEQAASRQQSQGLCHPAAPGMSVQLLCASVLGLGRNHGVGGGVTAPCSKAPLPAEGQHPSLRGVKKGNQCRRSEGG